MRIAILSDPHSNLRAWNAVLADVASARVDRILCLGDLVGYGPSPVEVMESAYSHVHAFVLGNHDAVVAGKMSPDVFNDRARRLILWTRDRIGRRGADFLGSLPLVLSGEDYRCAHANFVRPSAFDYILEPEDAAASWAATREQLLFVGHTHAPRLFVLGHSGTPHSLDPQDFAAEPGKRYIVNVGSVGLPRDADGRASYVIFDDRTRAVYFRRVPFDMDAFRADVAAAGLDPADVPLLRHDPRLRLATVRETLDFSPATRREDEARDVVETASAEVASARRRAAHWKGAAIASVLLAALLAAGLALRLRDTAAEPLTSPARDTAAAISADIGKSDNFLPAFPEERAADGGLAPWGLSLDNARKAAIAPGRFERPDDPAPAPGIRIAISGAPQTVRFESPSLRIDAARAPDLVFDASVLPGGDFRGRVSVLLQTRSAPDAPWTDHDAFDFAPPNKSAALWNAPRSWSSGRKLPAGIHSVRIVLDGSFSGSAVFFQPTLSRK